MVAQPNARREPGTVVVHLQNAAATCRAVVGAVRLPCLAFLAEAELAISFHGKGGRGSVFVCRQGAIAAVIGGATGRCEDCGRICPVEESVEENAE